jgi:hypothetical protein
MRTPDAPRATRGCGDDNSRAWGADATRASTAKVAVDAKGAPEAGAVQGPTWISVGLSCVVTTSHGWTTASRVRP